MHSFFMNLFIFIVVFVVPKEPISIYRFDEQTEHQIYGEKVMLDASRHTRGYRMRKEKK